VDVKIIKMDLTKSIKIKMYHMDNDVFINFVSSLFAFGMKSKKKE